MLNIFNIDLLWSNQLWEIYLRHELNLQNLFKKTSVNFTGPFSVKISLRRNAPSSTAYTCVWVCFVTKAVHIELVGDLSTQSFLNALKRFCDRRGLINDFYLDIATKLFRANRRISKLNNLFLSSEQQEKLQNWHG